MSSVIGYATELLSHPPLPMAIFPFAWMEGILEARIVKMDDHDAQGWDDVRRWTSGRLFGEKGEYRWQSTNNRIHAVFILDEGALPEDFQSITLENIEEDSSLILWGTWVNPEDDPKSNPTGGPIFYDRSLPRPQFYPLPVIDAQQDGMAPCLIVRRYRHISSENADNLGEFIRCVGFCMKPASQEEG
jgi:hypothetical protein